MDRIYDEFVTRVASGRKLPVERVREIAKGRVWTGAQADTAKAPAANRVLTMIFMVVSLRRAQPQRTCSMMPVCSL